jgi:hypothetical protein
VRTPIDLNDEPLRQAGEIDDETVDRHLLAKLEAGLLQWPQRSPKSALSRCFVLRRYLAYSFAITFDPHP